MSPSRAKDCAKLKGRTIVGSAFHATLAAVVIALLSVGCEGPIPPVSDPSDTVHGGAHRPVVGGSVGMVTSNHPQASAAGMEILAQGGNALDAAVATGAALGVVEPSGSGIGGVGWMTIYWAETDEIHVLNFTGRSPAALEAELFAEEAEAGGERLEALGLSQDPRVALIPGAAAAWAEVTERFGSLEPNAVLAPAIRLAENGHPLTVSMADRHEGIRSAFLEWDAIGADTWWNGASEAPGAGEVIRNPNLAATYRYLGENGFESFYSGWIAEEIASHYQRHGGVLTTDDFEAYSVSWEEPLHTTYRGHDVWNVKPNSRGGLSILQILNILEGFDLTAMGMNSPDYIHVMVEAFKLAGEDGAEWSYADPELLGVEVPFDRLLSKEYADERRGSIDMQRAATDVAAGIEVPGGTTHYNVVDGLGNMVSVTTTMGTSFGVALVGGETGVILNNRGRRFELDPDSPAFVGGCRRIRCNMAPSMIGRDGVPFAVLGTPGGNGIWQTQPQLITKIIDFGMDIQNAIESPRFRWDLGGTTVNLESRISSEVLDALAARGHDPQLLEPWSTAVGGMSGIIVDRDTGTFQGGADPRRDGYVVGW
jgi:gamma-glutamyltranspeptidase / glutathione hydrolase